MLDDRKSAILRAVVQTYIETAQPVGSTHVVDATAEELATETARARLVLRGQTRLRARPEVLGSLAFAAPCIEWRSSGEGTTAIDGLVLVGAARDLHDLELRGALWVRGAVHALHRESRRPFGPVLAHQHQRDDPGKDRERTAGRHELRDGTTT